MAKDSIKTRSELPWLLGPLAVLLIGWYIWNVHQGFYGEDRSEGGRYTLISYGSDANPARREQMNIFNRYYQKQRLKIDLIPDGSNPRHVPTKAAAGAAPYILDAFREEDLRNYAQKGIALRLNDYLKQLRDEKGYDITDPQTGTWQARLENLRLPNPDWQEGDDPLDRWHWYGVPNNMNIPMVWFNATLFQQVLRERGEEDTPPGPWLNWTWWDYATLAKAMHRRSADGRRFLSFGGDTPALDLLYLQIGLSMRGESPEAFAALDPAERAQLGLGELGWDEAITMWQPDGEGGHVLYPNRHALQQALQYNYDLTHAIEAVPSKSDSEQMANAGGGFSGGWGNAFKAGNQGMFITGRWFVGQVRSECGFEWRLLRIPRWVPYTVWKDWQDRELAPAERDGPWGETAYRARIEAARTAGRSPEEVRELAIEPLRGYGAHLSGRISFMSSSTPEELRPKAFKFLEFLLTNQDFNKILMVEDGLGADVKVAREYLAKPDPNFPEEVRNRPPNQELGALEALYPKERWPFNNHRTDKQSADKNLFTYFNKTEYAKLESGQPIAYEGFERWFDGKNAVESSNSAVGAALAEEHISDLRSAYEAGVNAKTVEVDYLPNLGMLLFFGFFVVFFTLMGYSAKRTRMKEAAGG